MNAAAPYRDPARRMHNAAELLRAHGFTLAPANLLEARKQVLELVAAAREAVRRHPDLMGLESALTAFPPLPEDPTP